MELHLDPGPRADDLPGEGTYGRDAREKHTKNGEQRGIGNVVGGFVAGLYSVPEGIGYASLAGINPMYGIYAGMVPVAVAAAATGSVLMMSTPTSAIALTMGGVLDDSCVHRRPGRAGGRSRWRCSPDRSWPFWAP